MLALTAARWPAALISISLGLTLPSVAADVTVTTQSEFDAAVAAATQPGAADTINVDVQNISSGPALMLPAAASSIVINFNGVPSGSGDNPTFNVGLGATGQLDVGSGSTLNFNTANGIARFNVGRFNSGNGGDGTVNMTGGSIIGSQTGSNYFALDVGRGSPDSVGVFNQSGGLVDMASGAFQIGVVGGTGTYTMSNEAVVNVGLGTVYIGDGVSGNGTLNIHDNAQFTIGGTSGQFYIGNNEGTGTVNQDGAGSLVNSTAPVGINLGSAVDSASGIGGVGAYNLSAGELRLGGSGGNAGLTLGQDAQGTGTFTQTGGLVVLNGGQIRFGPGTGTYNLNDGTLQVNVANPFAANVAGTHAFNLGGGTIQALTGFSTSLAFSLTSGTSTIDTNGFNAAFSGVLDGVGALSKIGAGALTLSGNNTFSGGTVLNGGSVVIGSATAFGTGDVTFAASSTLQFGGAYTLANGMTIDSGVVATMNTNGNTDTLSGVIDGAGALLKTGAGTLIFNAAETYTGGTQIAGGTLRLGTGGSLAATGALQIDTLGTFDLNNQDQVVSSLSGDGTVLVGTGAFTAGGDNANAAFSGTITMTNQGYQSPYGTFTKVGTGTLTIDGATFELGETYIQQGKMAQTSGNTSVSYLAVGDGQTSGNPNVGGLDVSGGTITFGTGLQVGSWGGQGTVNQTGGTVQVLPECGNPANCSAMHIGNQGGTGTYNISGGELDLTGRLNSIGRSTGTNPGSTGTLNISGTGVVDVAPIGGDPSRLIIGFGNANAAQAQSQGTINQTGGTLRIHDGATLNIGGQNTSTGVYNLYGGTLEVGGSGLVAGYQNANPNYEFNLGGGTVKVIEAALTTDVDATLSSVSTIDTNGFGATWSGALSGDGALVKAGVGALIFNAANTYTGGTEIAAGTLRLGTGGSLAATGALQIDELGTFDLNGHTQTVGEFAGAGDVLLGLGTLTAGGALNTEFSGSFSGGGTFEKKGSGTLYLTGDSGSFTGDTLVDGGKLVVNGSLASEVTVESGTLGGSGTIGGLIVSGDGTMAPGNSIGTINVAGNVIFQNQSIYEVELNGAGQTDLIEATGTATMNGGTVQVLAQAGAYSPLHTYTILTSVGARQGEFDDVTSNLAFLTPTLAYDDHNVFLTLTGNGTAFVDVAQTPNERATAQALSQFPQNNPLYENIIGQNAAGAQQAFDALSGEGHASVSGVLANDSHYVRDAIFGRLIQASYTGAGSEQAVAFGAAGPTTVAMLNRGGRMSLGAGIGDGVDPGSVPGYGHGLTFWTSGFGSWGELDGNGNAATAQRNLGGFVSGVDAGIGGGWRAGLATGYIQSNINVGTRSSSAEVNSYVLAGYAGGTVGAFAIRSGGAWTWHGIDSTRNVIFPGFFEAESASYNADTGQLFAEIAYPLLNRNVAIEPFAGLAYVHVGTDSFGESGPTAALTSAGSDQNVGYSLLGVRAATTLPMAGVLVTPHGSVAWQYAFGDLTPEQALAFASTGIAFGISGVPIAQSSALIEAGLDFALGPDAVFGISYAGQLAGDLQDNGVQGRLDIRY